MVEGGLEVILLVTGTTSGVSSRISDAIFSSISKVSLEGLAVHASVLSQQRTSI